MNEYSKKISFGIDPNHLKLRTEGQHDVETIVDPDSNGYVKVVYKDGGYEMLKYPIMKLTARVTGKIDYGF